MPYSFATISDIHLGTTAVPASSIIDALDHYIIRETLPKVDALFINGDLFDRGLRWTDPIIPTIEEWVVNLLLTCAARNVALRVLEGTPSHDRGQNGIFDRFIKYLDLGERLDFKYIDCVCIEYMARLNAHVLYVPDGEINVDNTFLRVKECLVEHGIERVDLAMMHGTMDYQLPEVANTPKHNAADYLSVVKQIINIGHIHDAHQHQHIYGNGSFFYTEHGYVKPKGFWIFTVDGDKHTAEFINNKKAPLMMTVDCRGKSLEESTTLIKNVLECNEWLYGSSLRIWAEKDNLIITQVTALKKQFNHIRWMVKQETIAKTTVDGETTQVEYTQVEITESTITKLVEDLLRSRNTKLALIDKAIEIIEGFKQS